MSFHLVRFSLVAPCVALLSLLQASAGGASVVLNEVLYDPAGEDAGSEFVELWNSADSPEPLAGVRLEAGDGARPGAWEVVFAAGEGDTIPARGLILVGPERLTGALQNGPDALRLTRDGIVIDRVGWGALAGGAFFEGTPAPDAASGESLSRRGDGADSDDNAVDWEAAGPTPGGPNHPPYRVVFAGIPRLQPEVAWPGDDLSFTATLRHSGRRPLAAGEWFIALATRPRAPGGSAPFPSANETWVERARWSGAAIEPGESLDVSLAWRIEEGGPFDLRAAVWTRPDDESEAGLSGPVARDSLLVPGRVGAGPVAVNEFAYRDEGAGEWVEIAAVEAVPSWSGFALGDATGTARRLVPLGTDRGAGAGDLRLVVADPARFAARFAIPESLLLTLDGSWPSFNDATSPGDPAPHYADVVRIVGPDGVPCDAVPYEEGWSVRGGSLERLSVSFPSALGRSWSESVAPAGGTPGAANSVAAFPGGLPVRPALLAARRRVLRRDGAGGRGALVLELGPGVTQRSVRLSILDLRGRVRRRLATGERFGSESALVWDGTGDDGRPVEPGLYLAALEASAAGQESRRAAVTIGVAPREGRAP